MKRPIIRAIGHVADSPPLDLLIEANWTPSNPGHQRNFELTIVSLDEPSNDMRIDLSPEDMGKIITAWQSLA